MGRPPREHDPEWFWWQRVLSAAWKLAALVLVGLIYGLAVRGAGMASAAVGLGLIVLGIYVARA